MHHSHNEIVMITALIAQMINPRQVEKTEDLVRVKGCWLTQIHLTQTLSILTPKFLNAESTASQSGYWTIFVAWLLHCTVCRSKYAIIFTTLRLNYFTPKCLLFLFIMFQIRNFYNHLEYYQMWANVGDIFQNILGRQKVYANIIITL